MDPQAERHFEEAERNPADAITHLTSAAHTLQRSNKWHAVLVYRRLASLTTFPQSAIFQLKACTLHFQDMMAAVTPTHVETEREHWIRLKHNLRTAFHAFHTSRQYPVHEHQCKYKLAFVDALLGDNAAAIDAFRSIAEVAHADPLTHVQADPYTCNAFADLIESGHFTGVAGEATPWVNVMLERNRASRS